MQDVKRLVLWLPAQTESLLVAKGAPEARVQEAAEEDTLGLHLGPKGALYAVRKGKFGKELSGHPVVLSAVASCCFRRAKRRLAMNRYRGCDLVLFEEDLKDAADELMKAMAAEADASLQVEGRDVHRFDEWRQRDQQTHFVTFATPKLLAVATDEEYLRDLLKRIDATPRASFIQSERLEASLPLDADVWAVRRYKSLMLEPDVPRDSTGFIFRLADAEEAIVRFFATEDTEPRRIVALFPPIPQRPTVKQTGKDVFEIRYNLTGSSTAFWFVLMARMGH